MTGGNLRVVVGRRQAYRSEERDGCGRLVANGVIRRREFRDLVTAMQCLVCRPKIQSPRIISVPPFPDEARASLAGQEIDIVAHVHKRGMARRYAMQMFVDNCVSFLVH